MALSPLSIQEPLDFNGIEDEVELSISCSDLLVEGDTAYAATLMAANSSPLTGLEVDSPILSINCARSETKDVWKGDTLMLKDNPHQHGVAYVPMQSTADAAKAFARTFATQDSASNTTAPWYQDMDSSLLLEPSLEQQMDVYDVLAEKVSTRGQGVLEDAVLGGSAGVSAVVGNLGHSSTRQPNLNKTLLWTEEQPYGLLPDKQSPMSPMPLNTFGGFHSDVGQPNVAWSRQVSCEPEVMCDREGCSELEEADNNNGGMDPSELVGDGMEITSVAHWSTAHAAHDQDVGHGDGVQAAGVDAASKLDVVPTTPTHVQFCEPRQRACRPQHWRRVVCRLFRALLKGPCVDRVWQVTMQGKDQTGSPMYLCNAFLMAVLGEEGVEGSAPWPSKMELTEGIPGLMAYFARVLTWAVGRVVDAATVERAFNVSGATYKTNDDILTSPPMGIAPWCWSMPLDAKKIQGCFEKVPRRDAPLIVAKALVDVAEAGAVAALAKHAKPIKRRKRGKRRTPSGEADFGLVEFN
eukprot:gene6475-6703_t